MTIQREDTRTLARRPEPLIREYLQTHPAAAPVEIVIWLRRFGIEMPAEVVVAILAAIKTG